MTQSAILSQRYLFTRLRCYLVPYTGRYLLTMLLLLMTSVSSVLPPIVLKRLIDQGIAHSDYVALLHSCGWLLVLGLFGSITRWCMEYMHEWVSSHFIFDLQTSLFRHVLLQPVAFFNDNTVGEILSRLRSDTTALYGVFANFLLGAVSEVVQIVSVIGILAYLDWKLTLILLFLVVPVVIVITKSRKPMQKQALVSRDASVAITEFYRERLSHVPLIRLYNGVNHEMEYQSRLGLSVITETLHSVKLRFVSTFAVSMCVTLSGVAILLAGGWSVMQHRITVGALFAFYVYCGRLFTPIQSITNRSFDIHMGIASAQRIVELLDVVPDIKEPLNPIDVPLCAQTIDMDHVRFSYEGCEQPAVQDLSFSIHAGERVALVGSSGAGKSTIVSLLTRLYDAQEGTVAIGGVPLTSLSFHNLYSLFGVFTQEPHILDATIWENISYGSPDATMNQVVRASVDAHLHDFVASLPEGYRTRVGPGGNMLSGGQRQRLALARLLLKDAPIWVLDEYTSALDSQSEARILDNLEPHLAGKTVIYIAHRLSTILEVDRVFVMQEGRLIAADTHRALYNANTFYRNLFDRQYISTPALQENS